MLSNRVWALTPAKIILGGFFLIITAGALLLTLPISSKSGEMTPFIDAFFTATSATCVTDSLRFDGNAPLPLQIHVVEHLRLHLPAGEKSCLLYNSVCKG